MQFRFKDLGKRPDKAYGFFAVEYTPDKGVSWTHLLTWEDWGFSSCAMANWSDFGKGDWNYSFWKKKANIDALVKWLALPSTKVDQYSSYRPREYYFLLGYSQQDSDHMLGLIQCEFVKEIDSFSNKAHGTGGDVKLYRLSLAKDFK